MNKKTKKGFTIVELVIVIAVIAILAAVLIPTFSGVIEKAKVSNDVALVKNINTVLATEEIGNAKPATMTDALAMAQKGGYTVEKLTPRSTGEILWNSKTNRFMLVKGDDVVFGDKAGAADVDIWQIASKLPNPAKYSIYAKSDWEDPTVDDLKEGFDAGEANITSISYVGNGTPQSVVIRTNSASTTLKINVYENGSECDTVNHYGVVGKIEAVNVGMSSYHENGKAYFVELQKGKIVAENESQISVLYAKSENVAVVENGGTVSAAYSTEDIDTTNKANGGTVTIAVATESAIASKGQDAQNQAVEGEKVEDILATDPSVVAYVNDGTQEIHYTSLEAAVNATNNGTINLIRDQELKEVLTIANKNLRIVGKGDKKPVISGNIVIAHTSGGHSVELNNINIVFSDNGRHGIMDISTCTSASDVNDLRIEQCLLYADFTASSAYSMVAICPTNGRNTGTHLIFADNICETSSFEDNKSLTLDQQYIAAVNTNAINTVSAGSPSYGKDVYNYQIHTISNNSFIGAFYYAYIGGYAEFSNNTCDGSYYKAGTQQTSHGRAFQFRGAQANSDVDGQFVVYVNGNTFKNYKELLKFYDLDSVVGTGYTLLDIGDNTYENIPKFGSAGDKATKFGNEFGKQTASLNLEGIPQEGRKIAFKLAQVELELSGELITDDMTLANGTQVMTYTQAVKPASGRTGYYIVVEGKTLWYFATATQHYFIDDDNCVYIVSLGSGGATTKEQLKFTEKAVPSDWPAAYTCERGNEQSVVDAQHNAGNTGFTLEKVIVNGDFYKTDFTIDQKDSNTAYNGTLSKDGNKLIVSSSNASSVNLFISNVNGCSKLLVTTNASATADSNTYVVVVPGAIGQLVVSGTYEVVIDVDIANVTVLGAQSVTINEGKTVAGILKITGTDAIGASVINNGKIGSLYVYAKTTVTNNGEITSVLIGNSLPGGISEKLKTVIDAQNTIITNNGTIMSIHAITTITLTNNNGGSIDGLTIAFLDAGMQYAKGSIITNSGSMCNLAHGNINLYVQCSFTNAGTIGKEGRATGKSSNCECKNIGGCINIGYWGFSDAHDGLVFTNTGTIYAGARHNDAHQQYTFWLFGVKAGYGSTAPWVRVNNTGTIYGQNWITAYDLAADHNVPTTYQAA